ncbi:MAG: S8 family serine peptidase, partial [Chloroflexota bacterium]|nr:S8 family serine peptidase [Chloroflexota bacterium]
RKGVVGVAPGVRLWAVKVLNDNGSGSFGSVICGLDWVLATRGTVGIDLVNMSLGGPGDETTCLTNAFHQAVCNVVDAGVTVVVSAGNKRKDAKYQVPANFDEVITVSAMHDFNGLPGGGAKPTCLRDGKDDTFAGNYSNHGADVDIMAPGSCIRSTWLDKQYQVLTGTSMAAPHVTGAAALYIATTNQEATPDQVKAWLLGDASRDQNDEQVGVVRDLDPDDIPERLLYLGDT